MAKFTVSNVVETTLKTWSNLLSNLTFTDNFKGFEWEGDFSAGETVKITHDLKVIPTRFLVIDCRESSAPIYRPALPKPTDQFFYLTSGSNFNGKVLILP